MIGSFIDVMLHNKTLTSLDLSGLEAEEGWSQLGDALRLNTTHQVYMPSLSSFTSTNLNNRLDIFL